MKRFAMGWLSDRADFRDHTPADSGIARKLKSAVFPKGAKAAPQSVDLRPWCSPVEDQGELGSCTAQVGAGVLEYYWLRANGELLDISRLFLYCTTRRLMGWNGDAGAFLRHTMKAMVVFGVPPEQYWPYAIARFDDEPEAFCYAFAQNYKSLEYYRLDPPGSNGANTLTRVKTHLAAGLPSIVWLLGLFQLGDRRTRRFHPLPRAGRSHEWRPRRGVRWPRRRANRPPPTLWREDHRRLADPQLLGRRLGRSRLRLAALRVRAA